MNCQNCGAPMRLVRDRDYYVCDYCRTYHLPSASPDGVRWLGEAPEGYLCALCQQPLHRVSLDERYQGYQCRGCQGILLHRPTFGETVQNRRLWATGPTDPVRPMNQEELHRRIDCPACNRRMDTQPYYGPGTLVIDTCDRCDLIWLDRGELARIVNAPGRDRGAALARVSEKDGEKDGEKKKRKGKKRWRGRKRGFDLVDLLEGIDLLDLVDDIFS